MYNAKEKAKDSSKNVKCLIEKNILFTQKIEMNRLKTFDLSIGYTETKYIKLNTKTQNIFCFVNENLTTFLYTLTGGTRKQKEKKKFSFLKCI